MALSPGITSPETLGSANTSDSNRLAWPSVS